MVQAAQATYPTQVCLGFDLKLGKRALRPSDASPPGYYVCFFPNSDVKHNSSKIDASDDTLCLPILPWSKHLQKSADMIQLARTLCQDYEGVLTFFLPENEATIKKIQRGIYAELDCIGAWPSCQSVGLLRGGGFAFCKGLTDLRSKPEFLEMFRFFSETCLGRDPVAKHLPTIDAPLITTAESAYTGLDWHRDPKRFAETHGYVQVEVVPWPFEKYPVVIITCVHYLGPPGYFSFPDSRDLLEVLGDFLGRERPPGRIP